MSLRFTGRDPVSHCQNDEGAVLVTSLLILTLLAALGLSASYLSNTEIIIANNLETATNSLYVAEGGLEIAKVQLLDSAENNFTAVPGTTNASVAGFTYSSACDTNAAIPCRTITHPLYWVDTTWFEFNSGTNTCTTTAVNGLSVFPVCREYTIGNETSRVVIDAPSWVPSNPTKIMFRNLSSRHTSSSPNKVVSANFEIDFGNNLAVFQELRSNTGETKDQIDNVVTPDTAILSFEQGWEFAMGGTGNLDRISGIYTGESKIRVEYCLDATLSNCAGIWKNLGIPATDDGNGTFLLGPTTTTTLPASSNCFYTDASVDFPALPTIVLDTMFSGYHFRIVEIADSDACS